MIVPTFGNLEYAPKFRTKAKVSHVEIAMYQLKAFKGVGITCSPAAGKSGFQASQKGKDRLTVRIENVQHIRRVEP
jgi:hypothetical protein